jgi:tryptophan-rich sensory protein
MNGVLLKCLYIKPQNLMCISAALNFYCDGCLTSFASYIIRYYLIYIVYIFIYDIIALKSKKLGQAMLEGGLSW